MLFDVDATVKGYPEIRHHYNVAADDQADANDIAMRAFRGWLLTNATVGHSCESRILRRGSNARLTSSAANN